MALRDGLPGDRPAGVRDPHAHRTLIPAWLGKALYGALFTLVLPIALALWAARLDRFVPLPTYTSPVVGAILVVVGGLLFSAATIALWVHGEGLPMSVYPPRRFVSTGVYRYFSNPMYIGAVVMCVGVSLVFGSPAGLWIVSPLLAASAAAWVLGYERDVTRARFGATRPRPLHLPPADQAVPSSWDRGSVFALVFLPWLLLYQAVEFLGVPPDATVAWQTWDRTLPVLPWTELLYALTYPFVLAVPLIAATRADLRWFMTRGWIAMATVIPFYLLVPIIAPAKPVVGDGVLQTLMRWERAYDEPVTAFPAFHIIWVCLAAVVYARRWKSLSALWWLIAAAISVSCVTVGMHAALDVAGAAVVIALILHIEAVWDVVRRGAERLANSWRELDVGSVRFINHGIYAALGACAGVLAAVMLAGPDYLWPMIGIAAAAIVGAGIWAQVVEGSPHLLRPYGYFGSVAGAAVALTLGWALGADFWLLSAAVAIGATLTQAIGRARCLVQGCCHGIEGPEWLGIRYTHPRSRVIRLSGLASLPLHPTPLYSAGWMLVVGVILLRLWMLAAGMQFIVGMYFILTGLGRFVEEHYRGEPQTMTWGGLRLYQWLAILFVVAGAATTAIGWTPAPARISGAAAGLPAIVAFGVAVYFAYGVDFPKLTARFSRLA